MVSKLFKHDKRVEIKDTLKLYFDSNVIISPLFGENTLVDMDCGPLNDLLENLGKWQKFGAFHLNSTNGTNVPTEDQFIQRVVEDGFQLETYL